MLVKQHTNGFIGNRVLKLNVGFLLVAGPGHQHETALDIPAIRVAEDVDLDYLRGILRLSRTKEGILVQGELHAGFEGECYRCLDILTRDEVLEVEELYAHPPIEQSEFSIAEDGILDLVPLLRAEILIAEERGVLCKPDCQGLCMECGANLNLGDCGCPEDDIDPRFANLRSMRDELG